MNGGICCWGKISGRAGRRFFWVAWCWSVCLIAAVRGDTAADRFVEIRQFIPDIAVDLRYHGSNNFLGRPVQGYAVDRCWITLPAAKQLAKVQAELRRFGFSLKVFDAYRPQQAVDDFLRWIKEPADPRLKRRFFPSVTKPQLLADGYIAARSGHSRGSSIDLTIVVREPDGRAGEELDMGTEFDYFDPASHSEHLGLTPRQRANRLLLRTLMERHGFVYYSEEWWHFRLKDEPFPDTWFNFPTSGPPGKR